MANTPSVRPRHWARILDLPHRKQFFNGLLGLSVAAGEGELLWSEILDDAARRELKPLYDARGQNFDLAQSQLPAFELLDTDRYNRLTVQASRGCPWRCSFCASSTLLTSLYKQKPIDRVLREIDRIREVWPQPFIEFADDNAFINRRWWKAFLPELASRRVRWFAESDLSVSQDPELLRLLREAGCAQILIGFESPVPAGLAGIELKRDWKATHWPEYRQAVQKIQASGIRVTACFVVGLDGHNETIFDSVYDFVTEVAPFDVQITYPTPFPGTPFYRSLSDQGRLTHDREWERCTLFDINFEPSPLSETALREGFHDLTRRLYAADFTSWRKSKFKEHLRLLAS